MFVCTSARHSNKFDNLLIYNVLHLHQGNTANAVALFSLSKRQQKRNGNTAHAVREVVWAVFFFSRKLCNGKKIA